MYTTCMFCNKPLGSNEVIGAIRKNYSLPAATVEGEEVLRHADSWL